MRCSTLCRRRARSSAARCLRRDEPAATRRRLRARGVSDRLRMQHFESSFEGLRRKMLELGKHYLEAKAPSLRHALPMRTRACAHTARRARRMRR